MSKQLIPTCQYVLEICLPRVIIDTLLPPLIFQAKYDVKSVTMRKILKFTYILAIAQLNLNPTDRWQSIIFQIVTDFE